MRLQLLRRLTHELRRLSAGTDNGAKSLPLPAVSVAATAFYMVCGCGCDDHAHSASCQLRLATELQRPRGRRLMFPCHPTQRDGSCSQLILPVPQAVELVCLVATADLRLCGLMDPRRLS